MENLSSPEHEGGELKERVKSIKMGWMIMIAPTKGPGEALAPHLASMEKHSAWNRIRELAA